MAAVLRMTRGKSNLELSGAGKRATPAYVSNPFTISPSLLGPISRSLRPWWR